MFQTTEKRRRDEAGVEKDAIEMRPTQIGRALQELGIVWIGAHSPQAKGRVERNFGTAQDRLVKGMRVAGVKTIEEANRYLQDEYLAWWERAMTVEAANGDDAHRRLEKSHNLAASLSHVEARQVRPDYTIRWDGRLYQIAGESVVSGLRGSNVRVERRLDGSVSARYGEKYLCVRECAAADKPKASLIPKLEKRQPSAGRRTRWKNNDVLFEKRPKLWQAVRAEGYRRETNE